MTLPAPTTPRLLVVVALLVAMCHELTPRQAGAALLAAVPAVARRVRRSRRADYADALPLCHASAFASL